MANITDTQKLAAEIAELYGEETRDRLFSYIDMVLDRNRHINLTAVKDRDEAMQKHLADSLTITDLPEYREAETVLDVGTGAGFPGALLAIVSPQKKFVLMDSTLKRLKVIDEFAQTLGISNLVTLHARAEEICRKPEYNGQFDLCVSRAVADLSRLSGWCLPFVRTGGCMVAYKGSNYKEELDAASASLRKYKGRLERVEVARGATDDISGHVLLIIGKK